MNTAAAPPQPTLARFPSRVRGTLLGGALGDQLGAAVEFSSLAEIRAAYGAEGLRSFSQLPEPGHFTDDTQLTLYTLDALLEVLEWANDGIGADETACLWLAYLRWYRSQGLPLPAAAPEPQPRWIDGQEVLRHQRAPGKACLSGLAGGTMGTPARPVNPESKGCGTVMRSAPFGLLPFVSEETITKFAVNGAALTHGHRAALQGAAAFALLIHRLAMADGGTGAGPETPAALLRDAVAAALAQAQRPEGSPEVAARLSEAVSLAAGPALAPESLTARLGEGWVAEEALAIAAYAALSTLPGDGGGTPQEHFRSAIAVAVNHDGDSDSTGSITGNILGALYGVEALPADWLEALEAPEVLNTMADKWIAATVGAPPAGPDA